MKQRQNPAQPAGAGASGMLAVAIRPSLAQPRLVRPRITVAARNVAGSLLLSLGLAGCPHKTHWAPPSSTLAPVEPEPLPQTSAEPMIAAISPPEWIPLESVEDVPKRPVRRRPVPNPARDATPLPPTQVAGAPEAELAIGSLSSGGDSTPQTRQQARELLSTIHRRVLALPHSVVTQQKAQIRQVTSFLKQAQQALDSGDAEGAVTLATKARLLMDDIEKK